MKSAVISVSLLILLSVAAYSQLHDHPVRLIDELPSTFVTDIDQDSSGFIWISTYEGLCRYDGTRLRVYTHEPGDLQSLPGNYISEVEYDHARRCLWVGTDGGLCRMDPATGKATHIIARDTAHSRRLVEALVIDKDGSIWFSLDQYGIGHLLPEAGLVTLHSFEIDSTTLIPAGVGAIRDIAIEAGEDRIWIGTSGGLMALSKTTGQPELLRFATSDIQQTFYLNQIRTVLPGPDGTLYLGTWSGGVIKFKPDFREKGDRDIAPGMYTVFGDQGVMPPLTFRDRQHLWVSLVEGICALNIEDGQMEDCFRLPTPNDRYFPMVVELYDHAGRIWASSEQGVYVFDRANALIQNYHFTPGIESHFYVGGQLTELPQDNSILATYERCDGVYRFDRHTRNFTLIQSPDHAPGSIDPFIGEGMAMRTNGTVIVTGRERLYTYTPETQSLSRWHTPLDDLGFLWRCITEDSAGNLWLGTVKSGLVRYTPATREVKIYDKELQRANMDWPNPIDDLFIDSRGNIWISMWSSYAVYEAATRTIVPVPYIKGKKFETSQFAEDAEGDVWVGVEHVGVGRVSKDSHSFAPDTVYGSDSGLPDLDVRSLTFDRAGSLWMITPSGLQSFNPKTGAIRQLTEKDGVIMYDPNFNRNPMVLTKLYTLSDGQIAYVPRAGLSLFDPGNLPLNTETPQPYIYAVTVRGSTQYHTVDQSPALVRFKYGERPMVVHLSALGFTQSAHNIFQYKLTQSDTSWIDAPNGDIVFNTLNPGRHAIYYRVLNSNGVPSPAARLGIRVMPPWWLSWWFVALVAALIACALWAVIYWRQRSRDALRKRENEVRVLMATLESRALRSQMNPHFLFNIFNTIQELILTGDNDMAYLYTSKFSKLLRMILENAGKDTIQLGDEKAFLDLYLELETLRFDDAFSSIVTIEPGLEHHHIPVFMVQPLVENAIRHGLLPKQGEKDLIVRFDSQGDLLVCTVRDNGVGLLKQNTDNNTGRWHAIEMIRRRLEMTRSGKLTIQNGGNGGVEAKLTLPYS